MDRYILFQIRKWNGRSLPLDRVMVHVAKYGPLWFFVVMCLLVVTGDFVARVAVGEALVAAVVTRGINELVGKVYFRERPFVREGYEPLLAHRPSFSFPSNHAACGFALAMAVWLHVPGVGAVMVSMAVLLAFSRVFVGVHYPVDVTVGMGIGSLVACGVVWFCNIAV